VEKIVQLVGGVAELFSADVDLGQMQLWMGKMTRIELARPEQVFFSQIQLV
jgi:hypothetical protein